ncbi:MAG: Na+/H+ antiporter subunit E [Candidatus Omnitrophica bacterium]|nr:Na+/H+ antiporter subunit E [Candidatus Omnitrophota bacterium]MDD5238825.1 Na+/H+ antiporter subunit E [Candidatus Omnitrophota bacterium]
MKSKIILFIIGFIIWMLLGWPPNLQHALAGIFAAGFVAALTGDMFTRRPHRFINPSRYLWFGYYVFLFLWECLKANIDVALRVVNPKLPINPGIVKVKTTLKSDTALTFLANSITLTPGTFCIDIKPESGILYIHWINVESDDLDKATKLIVDKFEKVLKRVFE